VNSPRTPAHQLYYGPLYARDYFDRNLHHIISSNPKTVADMRKRYGRYLAGFGSEDMSGSVGYDPAYQGRHIYDLEKEDDTFGSGVFDPGGRGGTSNANMGIFAGHYSLPGYAARDVPFSVMKDVTDITDDAQVVSVPGGGMVYIEDRGRLMGAAPSAPTWRPSIQPAGATRYDQVYVDMQGKPVQMSGYGQLPRRRLHSQPPRVPRSVTSVPSDMVSPHGVPLLPAEKPVGFEQIVHGGQVPVPISRAANPVAAASPDLPMGPQVPLVSTANVAMQRIPVTGEQVSCSGLGRIGGPRGNVFGRVAGPRGNVFGAENGDCPAGQALDHYGNCVTPAPEGTPMPTCAADEIVDSVTMKCVPGASQAKPISAIELALWGLLAGAGVGLVVSVATGKGKRR